MILKDDVPGTGYRGEYVEVKAGFMRNYLFPKKCAMYATEENKFLYESVDRVSQSLQSLSLYLWLQAGFSVSGVDFLHADRRGVSGETN